MASAGKLDALCLAQANMTQYEYRRQTCRNMSGAGILLATCRVQNNLPETCRERVNLYETWWPYTGVYSAGSHAQQPRDPAEYNYQSFALILICMKTNPN